MPQMTKRPKGPPPTELGDDLIKQCREFMKIAVPSTNIVFADEFSKFMPLFNKAMYDQTDPNEVDELGREYNSRFSMQHPIQILTRTPDPNGIFHPGERRKYKLDRTIPAMFRRVSTLNDLGKKVPALMNAFFNSTTSTSGPFDHRKENYAKAIAEAVCKADQREGKIGKQRAEFAREARSLVSKQRPAAPTQPKPAAESEEPSTGMFEWD